MSAPIPSSVYAAIAEALGAEAWNRPVWRDAAEFLHSVREPMRALDDATHFRIGRQLLEQYAMCCIYPKDAPELPFVWFISDCTPEQQVRALAAAMGIEVAP